MQSNRQKILTYILTLLLVVAALYFYRRYSSSINNFAEIVTDESVVPVGEDVLAIVQKLDYITIDDSMFASPLFTYLKDTTVTIIQEDKSRPNPFAPINANPSLQVRSTPTPIPVRR